MAPADKGKDGLFGNSMDKDAYQRRINLAGAMSTKGETRPPVFDDSTTNERKNRELYGNSNYEPPKQEYKREFKPAHTGYDATLDRDTKNKKAGFLGSSILGNEDEATRPSAKWNQADKLVNPSTGWSSQSNTAQIINKGRVDPYKSKQNQLNSNVFEQTDYSAHAPMSKKETNLDVTRPKNYNQATNGGAKPKSDLNTFNQPEKREHNYGNAKQTQLRSAFDEGKNYTAPPVE